MNIYKTKKNSVFFSYSKDKDAILSIKKKISEAIDNNSMIFVSADEDSIPGGKNYLEEIISALDNAKIIFLFITPQSYTSPWMHYEAGYAIAKGKKVVPIGLNYEIESLIIPLSMQQGRNVKSRDGLNYIIRCINQELGTNIAEVFSEKDYNDIIENTKNHFSTEHNFSRKPFQSGSNANGEWIRYDNGDQECVIKFPTGLKTEEFKTQHHCIYPAAFIKRPDIIYFVGTEDRDILNKNESTFSFETEKDIVNSFEIHVKGKWK